MRYLSVCSGIEAATAAWHPLGWVAAGYCEIDPFPSAVLAHHYPTIPNFHDFTRLIDATPPVLRGVDLLVGGTPCQAFSVAGLRGGLTDPRGGLTLDFVRLVGALRPRWVVWENVPGVLSQDGGRAFGSFLGALGELGYGWAYRVLDAQHFGVPQRRRRVFVVACAGGGFARAASVLFEPEGVHRDLAPRRASRKGPAAHAGRGAQGDSGESVAHASAVAWKASHFTRGKDGAPAEITPPLSADADRGDQDTLIAVSTANPPVNALTGCWWDGGQVSQTLDAVLAKGQTMPEKNRFPAVLQPILSFKPGQSEAAGGIFVTEDYVPTLQAQNNGSTATPAVLAAAEVRRLTPVECERLQGFPDDYTAIPWRGKPASECPDGPRYKAIGNSMAVPVMAWIGRRIAALDRADDREAKIPT